MPESRKGPTMPKEYINWPQPERIAYARTQEELDAGLPAIDTLPPAPRIGLHWQTDGEVQLSFDVDWDVLQEMVKTRQENAEAGWLGADEGNFPNRHVFYTGQLDRPDLNRLIKHVRRARDAAYGSDE